MKSASQPLPSAPPATGTPSPTRFQRDFAVRGDYQRPDTRQTLREGLAEYYLVNPGLTDPALVEHAPTAWYFRCHDATHVVFGTHTGPLDEGVNDLFTMFGVDISFVAYVRGFLATESAKDIAKAYASPWVTLGLLAGSVRLLPKTWRTCRAMRSKWPWEPPADHLDRPLVELREAYGIAVWRPELVLGINTDR